jgi:hypothetical protein
MIDVQRKLELGEKLPPVTAQGKFTREMQAFPLLPLVV